MKYAFPPSPIPTVPIASNRTDTDTDRSTHFPVHRIYCVGRNYADHVREMGGDPDREPPFFFTKPADAVVPCRPATTQGADDTAAADTGITKIPFPLATGNLHYEIEMVVAIGKAGVQIPPEQALDYVYGYAVGLDLTRRDLQQRAKGTGRPWDSAKAFDQSAPVSAIVPLVDDQDDVMMMMMMSGGGKASQRGLRSDATTRLWCKVNGEERQSSQLGEMIWSVPEIISILSHEFHLIPGDLIFTGTPAGVGPIVPGDVISGGIGELVGLAIRIG
jgi:fumarylpyruvate hydrolase